jgi:hypothetical protein
MSDFLFFKFPVFFIEKKLLKKLYCPWTILKRFFLKKLNLSYGHCWTFPKTIPEPTTSFPTNFPYNYLIPFLITTSLFPYLSVYCFKFYVHLGPESPLDNIDMKRQISMCLFMSMIFILIQIKFDIDINNDEILKTIWKHKGKK